MLSFQPVDEGEDFGLRCHIKGGGRLIGNEQFGLASQCHRDDNPLAHAARKLVRVLTQPLFRFGNAHLLQQFQSRFARFRFAETTVQAHPFCQLPLHREDRIERRHRLLKNHRNAVATQLACFAIRRVHKINIVEQHLPAGDRTTAKLDQAHQRQRRDGLTRPGFAHDAEGFTGRDIKGQILDGRERARPT